MIDLGSYKLAMLISGGTGVILTIGFGIMDSGLIIPSIQGTIVGMSMASAIIFILEMFVRK